MVSSTLVFSFFSFRDEFREWVFTSSEEQGHLGAGVNSPVIRSNHHFTASSDVYVPRRLLLEDRNYYG